MSTNHPNIFDLVRIAWREWKKQRSKARDDAELRAIAKAFNNRYTYRKTYQSTGKTLPGKTYGELPISDGYRWMCPTCNTIHAPTEVSVWSGLQYPACCEHGAGHRLYSDIRTR